MRSAADLRVVTLSSTQCASSRASLRHYATRADGDRGADCGEETAQTCDLWPNGSQGELVFGRCDRKVVDAKLGDLCIAACLSCADDVVRSGAKAQRSVSEVRKLKIEALLQSTR